ncbi:MAG TPA: coenzyme F420-0:L-glutamate ligase [Candidatus Magasanikbacteria bacterium]|nr:coenzyme F420-0:L-glutamate ligase [Candidatus Magasanikbacteria bacterium]
MIVKTIKTKIFNEGENLVEFILRNIKKVKENSIIVVTSKIVALSERRTVVIVNEKTKEENIKKESEFAMPTKYAWLTIKDGIVMASAGIDESNAQGKLILLPKDSYVVARKLRNALKKKYGVKNLGILITDSRTIPLRLGVTGVALGYAGFRGIRDYRGRPDIFGRLLHFSRTNVADSLATAAVLEMGEADECRPLAVIEGATVVFSERTHANELRIDPRDDMYKPFFDNLPSR